MAGVQARINDFMVKPKGSGRCAPTLLEDLVLLDPAHRNQDRDLLLEPPVSLLIPNLFDVRDIIPNGSCEHVFWLKEKQSRLALLDARPDDGTTWIVAAVCSKCRMHLALKVDYTRRWDPAPCPTAERPLHHLVRSELYERTEWHVWEKSHPQAPARLAAFECTSKSCGAVVTVVQAAQRLSPDHVDLLTDQTLIMERSTAAFRAHEGSTQGMKHPSSIDVLGDLRAYIKNSWQQDDPPVPRRIQQNNKRFLVRFGVQGLPCKDVLEYLTFERLEEEKCWRVPMPEANDKVPLESPLNIFLDDVENELLVLMHNRPLEERQAYGHTSLDQPVAADRELARALACQDYDKISAGRNQHQGMLHRPAPFAGLGIPVEASDQLVAFAYRAQMAADPDPRHWPCYLQHLKRISLDRNSELLTTEVVLETSKGHFDFDDLAEAFSRFGTSLQTNLERTDEDIIGSFQSLLMDMPRQETELRQQLRIIGQWRNSRVITSAADDTMNTYEQALRFLDAQPSFSDDQIVAMFTVKVNDNKEVEEQARKAVRLISEHRQSFILDQWLTSGFLETPEMDVADAYATLAIDDRTCEDEWITLQYDVHKEDHPNNEDLYTRALTAIAKDRNSAMLQEKLQGSTPHEARYGNENEPVGLDNIGNTCYLNSLLQFLFTILELRDIVLNFDNYKMKVNEENMLQKRVGQRQVTRREVETAQQFVVQLAQLFNGMIETPSTAIRPEKELARLTLETHSAKEKIRRRSTLRGDRPSLGQMDGDPALLSPQTDASLNGKLDDLVVQSPSKEDAEMPDLVEMGQDQRDVQSAVNGNEMVGDNDNSSEATLVSTPGSGASPDNIETAESQQKIFDNKENLSPVKANGSPKQGDIEGQHPEPLAPASPSKVNAQAGVLSKHEAQAEEPTKHEVVFQPPPGKPPPVPPRKPIEPSTDILEEYARQQDVTEVIAHCLFQLSCAIRPTGKDEKSGEQLDEIHDMFFGSTISHTVPQHDTPQPVQFYSVITRVAHKPADIYEALDTEFDLSEREGGSKAFMSISHLPPIFSVALDRVGWDNTAKRPIKHNDFVQVPETIYLDRYLSDGPNSDLLERRQQSWELKSELSQLLGRQAFLELPRAGASDVPTLLSQAKFALDQIANVPADSDSDDEEPIALSTQSISTFDDLYTSVTSELEILDARITDIRQSLKESFSSSHFQHHPYRLHAAFFHRGGPTGGHYWVYIYDHAKNLWRKYNDDRVSVVENLNEVFGKPREGEWAPPTPYFLVYVQADKVEQLCQSVKRDVKYPPPSEAPPNAGGSAPRSQLAAMPPSTNQAHPAFAGLKGFGRADSDGDNAQTDRQAKETREMIEKRNGEASQGPTEYGRPMPFEKGELTGNDSIPW